MKRSRYLLGLSSPAEREQIESEYFRDEDAFEEMLAAEDDLIDAYARGELTSEERRGFEKSFVRSLSGRDRVQFARAFAGNVSATRSVETKLPGTSLGILKTFQSPGLLRTAMIVALIVFVAALAWVISDRRRMTNEIRPLRAESAELGKRTEALQRGDDAEQTHTADIDTQLADWRVQPKPKHRKRGSLGSSLMPRNLSNSGGTTVRGTTTDPNGNAVSGATVTLTDPTRNFSRTQSTNKDGAYLFNAIPPGTYSIKIEAQGFKTALASGLAALVDTPAMRDVQLEVGGVSETVDVTAAAEATINTSDAIIGNSFEHRLITELPLNANNLAGLLSLQPGIDNTGFVNGGRADQSNITLDGVDINEKLDVVDVKLDRADATVRIPGAVRWIRFQIALETAAFHEDYNVTIKTADGRPVTSVDWSQQLTPHQTIIDTPAILTSDLLSGDYLLLLRGKEPDNSFVKVAEYPFKVIEY